MHGSKGVGFLESAAYMAVEMQSRERSIEMLAKYIITNE